MHEWVKEQIGENGMKRFLLWILSSSIGAGYWLQGVKPPV